MSPVLEKETVSAMKPRRAIPPALKVFDTDKSIWSRENAAELRRELSCFHPSWAGARVK